MPPRRNNGTGSGGGIRGPASALTSFLAGLGVEPPSRLTTWGDTSALNMQAAPPVDPAAVVTAQNVEAGPSDLSPPRKRARASSINSDDLDAPSTPADIRSGERLKAVGEFMICSECTNRFTVTAYTKEHPRHPSTYLCVNCCYALGMDPFEKPKKAKVKPTKKEDRAKITHYETLRGAPSLGDLCIKMIGSYIEDVEQLGDIGGVNMDKVCRIISKYRKLTPETAPLFYSTAREELAMYDCTALAHTSFVALARLCPNLKSLRLDYCGQLSTEAVKEWSQTLRLSHLELLGPFLVRKEGWIEALQSMPLRALLITQSPRFDMEVATTLASSCPNLTVLRLAEVGQLTDAMLPALSSLNQLTHLDLSSPGAPFTDDAVTELLASIGSKLVTLNLSQTGLTDDVLPAIAKCSALQHLYLNDLDLSDNASAALLLGLSPGLVTIELGQAHKLKEKALSGLLKHSRSLHHVNISGWKDVDATSISKLKECNALVTLDIGWCREVTDFTLKDILDSCSQIELIRVWGCNQLTDAVPRKRGVRVVGIETHAI